MLFAAFDMTACRRRIFTVASIGDWYIAVAGLTEPQNDHAIVKFWGSHFAYCDAFWSGNSGSFMR
jgi:hypothetical protein